MFSLHYELYHRRDDFRRARTWRVTYCIFYNKQLLQTTRLGTLHGGTLKHFLARAAPLITALLIAVCGAWPARAQGPTETPTETPAFTATPTETPTITPTPDFYQVMTLEPSGHAGAVVYTITVGQSAIFAELVFVAAILLVILFVLIRKQS